MNREQGNCVVGVLVNRSSTFTWFRLHVSNRPDHNRYRAGTIGRISADGCSASWRILFVAGTCREALPFSSPVLRFRSNRGKLLLDTSSRSTCPLRNTLLVDQASIVKR